MTHSKAHPQGQLDLHAQTQPPTQQNMLAFSSILDNYLCGRVGDFLQQHIKPGATLSIVSAYFTIYAFEALKQELLSVVHVRFLYGEPRGITIIDPSRSEKKAFALVEEGLKLSQSLHQKRVAHECADWIRDKVEVRSIRRSNFMHGKMYHMEHPGGEEAVVGSSNFTVAGLGLGAASNIELNLVIDRARDRRDLKYWFDELWAHDNLVSDVKDNVLAYLAKLYANNAPQCIYYKTLFHLFEQYLQQQAHSDLLIEQDQFADTARYLYNDLCAWLRNDKHVHCALVVGTGDNKSTLGKSDFMHILTNFAPLAKKRADIPTFPNDEEIDVLIATDCISEGQNLQDCDYLINYDIHWNPVRIIQRFGRIDRIGSLNTSIHLVNFWPTPDLNKYINLKNRVEARMALVDITATGGR